MGIKENPIPKINPPRQWLWLSRTRLPSLASLARVFDLKDGFTMLALLLGECTIEVPGGVRKFTRTRGVYI